MDFTKKYDVAVAGAGIAGVAAAVQAAREGKKTVLLEKTIFSGGLATTGLVYIYLPICDGNGHQVSFGITEELLKLSLKYGPGDIPANWSREKDAPEVQRYRCIFSPAAYMLALDEFLIENGVDVWYDTLVAAVEKDDSGLRAVIVENESGRGRIEAKCFVDATGSALLARRAGLPIFDENNFLSIWAIEHNRGLAKTDLGAPDHMYIWGVSWDPQKAPAGTVYRGISGAIVSDFVLKSRKALRDHYKQAAAESGYDRHDLYALKLPAMPQFRKICAIEAEYVLDSNENHKRFEDSIGLCSDWRKSGPVWEIPYRTLYSRTKTGGLLAAGRCIGSRNDAWEVTRVIPVAGLTGQAAGMAAAMCADSGARPDQLDVRDLQAKLVKAGVKLHLPDVGLAYE